MNHWTRDLCTMCMSCALAGCGGAPASDADPTGPITLSGDVQPIFNARCVRCHVPGSALSSGLDLDLRAGSAHASIVGGAAETADLTLVVPGDPQASFLYLKVSLDDPPAGQRMPLFGSRLTAAELATLEAWIAAGAPDD